MSSHEITRATIESGAALKGGVATASGVGSAAYVISQQSCAVDYSSPHVFIPMVVSILAGIYTSLLIYEKIKKPK